MKLTKAQLKIIHILKEAEEIHYGVRWYIKIKDEKRWPFKYVDGRVCNSLVRKGILEIWSI